MIKECVISRINNKKSNILLKNRDRNYIPKIIIVRDYIIEKDLEICYYIDLCTGWIEGINSNGLALINSSLLVEYDEKEINLQRTQNKFSKEGLLILNALKQTNLKDFVIKITKKNRLNGHTFINFKNKSFSLESLPNSKIHFNKIEQDIEVRTNHGFNLKKTGYIKGTAKISTNSRLIISKNELNNLKDYNYENLLNSLSKDYINWDSKYQPNRNIIGNKNMFTTMQILMDTIQNLMYINYNPSNCKIIKIIDKRPTNIKKINLKITKNLK